MIQNNPIGPKFLNFLDIHKKYAPMDFSIRKGLFHSFVNIKYLYNIYFLSAGIREGFFMGCTGRSISLRVAALRVIEFALYLLTTTVAK